MLITRLLGKRSPTTSIWFDYFINKKNPTLIADIGSRNGQEAKRFRNLNINSQIVAIEPHPILFNKMVADKELKSKKIDILNYAVSNRKDILKFHIFNSEDLCGSLLKPLTDSYEIDVEVESLFSIFKNSNTENIFLWIDVEGLTWEVIDGLSLLSENVNCIHLEYETKESFKGQKLFSDVEEKCKNIGLFLIANNYTESVYQGNALFIRKKIVSYKEYFDIIFYLYPLYIFNIILSKFKKLLLKKTKSI
jgi:FkbM family methyltransferase